MERIGANFCDFPYLATMTSLSLKISLFIAMLKKNEVEGGIGLESARHGTKTR